MQAETSAVVLRKSLIWRLCRPIPIAMGIGCPLLILGLHLGMTEVTNRFAAEKAFQTAEIARTARNYYARFVIADVLRSRDLKASADHAADPTAIPIPATFLLDLADDLASNGTQYRFYSDLPFPQRAGRVLDEDQRATLAALRADPNARITKLVREADGRTTMRVATADRMAPGCVACHNSHPQSPRQNWVEGDVRAVFEGVVDVSDYVAAMTMVRWGLSGSLALMALTLIAFVARPALDVRRRLSTLGSAMQQLAAGRRDVASPPIGRHADEVTVMAGAFEVFKQNAAERDRLEAEQRAAEAQRQEELRTIAAGFEQGAGQAVRALSQTVGLLEQQVGTVTTAVQAAGGQVGGMNRAAADARDNTQLVAAAAEELAGTVRQITAEVSTAGAQAREAMREVDAANARVVGLTEAANRIGQAVTLIADIAGQTNLLALNATIESARAGEAGKGFSVVAGEVKALASRTAQATEEIRRQVEAIQQETRAAVAAIQLVGTAVASLDGAAASISDAVVRQGDATGRIADRARSSSQTVATAAEAAAEVGSAAASATEASTGLATASSRLVEEATRLQEAVISFVGELRRA